MSKQKKSDSTKLDEKQEKVVLAYGETTGHSHAFYEPLKVELIKNPDIEETKLVIKASGAKLEHEEHATHTFEPGIGEVIQQSEYTMGEIKPVID